MIKRISFPLLVLFLTIIFTTSCKDSKRTVADDTIDIALGREPAMINPYLNPVATAREIYQYIFIPMADFNPETYSLEPILIESIPNPEIVTEGIHKGKTQYTFRFRDEAQWDDGSPITAKDYEFSVKAIKHPETKAAGYRSYLVWISDVILYPEDKRKVSVIFDEDYFLAKELVVTMEVYPKYVYDPNDALKDISVLELNEDSIKDKIENSEKLKQFAKDFNDVKYGREIISGSGPYAFKEWVTKQTIVLEKKKNYWGENLTISALQADANRLVFHIVADQAALTSQLKEGIIDVAKIKSSSAFNELKENQEYKDDFQFLTPELMAFGYVAINNSKPILSDPDVRQALAKLSDVESLINVQESGLGTPTVGIFNTKKEYYNDDLKPIGFSIEEASSQLESDGWADTNNNGTLDKKINGKLEELELDIHISSSELSTNYALNLKENAKKVGIKINIITKPYSQIRKEHLRTGDFDLVPSRLAQTLTLDDPYSKWHSDNIKSGSNVARYNSPLADDLIEKIRLEKDRSKRNMLYKELQEVMQEDQPVIFLYNPKEKLIISKNWKAIASQKRPGYFANTFTAIGN